MSKEESNEAKEFMMKNSQEHLKAMENGYDVRMDEHEFFEWMEKYAQYKANNLNAVNVLEQEVLENKLQWHTNMAKEINKRASLYKDTLEQTIEDIKGVENMYLDKKEVVKRLVQIRKKIVI